MGMQRIRGWNLAFDKHCRVCVHQETLYWPLILAADWLVMPEGPAEYWSLTGRLSIFGCLPPCCDGISQSCPSDMFKPWLTAAIVGAVTVLDVFYVDYIPLCPNNDMTVAVFGAAIPWELVSRQTSAGICDWNQSLSTLERMLLIPPVAYAWTGLQIISAYCRARAVIAA
jgi:hypothetical protein